MPEVAHGEEEDKRGKQEKPQREEKGEKEEEGTTKGKTNKEKPEVGSTPRPMRKCWGCGQPGHERRDCPSARRARPYPSK